MSLEKSDYFIVAMKSLKGEGAKGVTKVQRVEQRQLSFVFADRLPGNRKSGHSKGTGIPAPEAWLKHIAKRKEPKRSTAGVDDTERLLEQVVSLPNMAKALKKVAKNKGAPGTDGKSIEEVVSNVRSLLPKLQDALLSGTYHPGDVRRVWIPKPGGGQRGLGIPNVVDRWVQQAVLQVMEPIFEPIFHDSSHGFRPNRGAHTAIAEARKYVEEGRDTVVDIDLSKFFDRVHHQRLLNLTAQRVKDGRVLKLIHRMLKAKVVMPDGARIETKEGTPQGGPLSPLLSNIVLDELDWELDRRGLKFVRYADDCNIYVKSERSGHRVMDATRRFIEKRLRLQINEHKSSVSRPEEVHFLGFRLVKGEEGQIEIYLSERSHKRIMQRIRELTPRSWGRSLSSCMEQINEYLRGWYAYFGICSRGGAYWFGGYDAHIRRRLRMIIIVQKKRRRHLYRHLIKLGVSGKSAWKSAYSQGGTWYRSHTVGIERAYSNAWFSEKLITLWEKWQNEHPEKTAPVEVSGGQLLLFA